MENVLWKADSIRRQDFDKGSIFPGYVSTLCYNTLKSDTALMCKARRLSLSDEETHKWKLIIVHSVHIYHRNSVAFQ